MHNRKKAFIILASLLLILTNNKSYSQDPAFSQFFANPLYLNPAFAGTTLCPRLVVNYRNQWPAISGTFVTYNASYDQHFDALSGGMGLLVMNDRAGEGVLNTFSANLMYSYSLKVDRKFTIKAALQGSLYQRSLDWSKLTFPDMIDPRYGFVYETKELPPPSLNKFYPDFAVGILGWSERVYGGVAAHHITQPTDGFFNSGYLPLKMTIHFGASIPLERRQGGQKISDNPITFAPNFIYMKQLDFNHLNYGAYFMKAPFVVGVWYRQNIKNPDALIAMIGFQESYFKFGYSYDFTVSRLRSVSGGAHEVSMAIQFPCSPPKKRIKVVTCPSF